MQRWKITTFCKIERFQQRLQFEEEEEEKENVEHNQINVDDDPIQRFHRVRYPQRPLRSNINRELRFIREIIGVDPYYASQDNGGTHGALCSFVWRTRNDSELLEYGGLINSKDIFGMTPLHRAATRAKIRRRCGNKKR